MKVRQLRWRFYKKKEGPKGLGNRCKDYAPGCYGCESYKFLDEHGRFPTFDEVRPIARKAMEEEALRFSQTPEGEAWKQLEERQRRNYLRRYEGIIIKEITE